MFPKGAVRKCYMLPVGVSMQFHRTCFFVRTIYLTQIGVSTNSVLDHIIDALLHARTKGIVSTDPTGRPCAIWIDVAG